MTPAPPMMRRAALLLGALALALSPCGAHGGARVPARPPAAATAPASRARTGRAAPPPLGAALGAAAAIALALGGAGGGAAPAGALLPPPNALVAEAWRVVDRGFADRTFNGADWFALRQERVKAKLASDEDAHEAIRSMLAPLGDKYTRFLTPAQFESIESVARGGVVGVGIELSPLPQPAAGGGVGVRVTRVAEGSPAEKGGLRPGDLIVRVDQQPLEAGLTSDEIASRIRGPPKSRVVLTTERDGGPSGGGGGGNAELERAAVKLQSVRSSTATLDGGARALVVEIRSFSSETPAQVAAALKKDGAAASALVLDLRANGGGSLLGGMDVARLLLPDGARIVSTRDKSGLARAFDAENGGALDVRTPAVVLVNRDTASAAEVLSAALRENGRAALVGERTYGKGVVQTLAKLEQSGGGGVAFTTARYATPKGNDINGRGITPDMPPKDASAEAADAAERAPPSACLATGGGASAAQCVPAAALALARELVRASA